MQDSHPNNNLRDDVLNDSLTENYVLALEVEVEVTHGGVVHDDVDVDLVLEGLFYVVLLDLGFLDYFHREFPACGFLGSKDNAAEGTLTEVLIELIIFRPSWSFLFDNF